MLEVEPMYFTYIYNHMLTTSTQQSWETYATALANATTDEALFETYTRLATDLKINNEAPANVIFARDTRTSGPTLVAALVDALKATASDYTDHKILTTPQLHYLVRCINTADTQYAYGDPSEKGYYEKLSEAFKQAMKHRKTNGPVTVDCANGVGGPKLRELIKFLPTAENGGVDIKVINDDVLDPAKLNVQVLFHSLH
jgi:phosphoacetylglucosamine mutase